MQNIAHTSKNIETEIEGHKNEIVESAATLLTVQKIHGEEIRKQTMQSYGRLIDAHLLIMGVLSSALLRVTGKVRLITVTSEERDALFASFVIGIDLCGDAIAEGRYLQASALLRQEMETIAQLKAVASDRRKEERSPNVSVLEGSVARLYGDLTAAAHLSRHDIVRHTTEHQISGDDLPGPTSGTRCFPAFDEVLARRLFSLHLRLILGLIEELSNDHGERHAEDCFSAKDARRLELAILLMQADGMVIVD